MSYEVSLVRGVCDALAHVRFPLPLPGTDRLLLVRDRVLAQLEARVLPYLAGEPMPTVVVLGGTSGAGKSTLFNSIVGEELSTAGVLRPTSREATIGVNPRDLTLLTAHPLLQWGTIVRTDRLPRGLILIDAPDFDTIAHGNRAIFEQVLNAADVWVLTTTASRYGDALAWRLLDEATRHGVTAAMLLNRVPDSARADVRAHAMARLADYQISAPLFLVADRSPHTGLLPADDVAEFKAWLDSLTRMRMGALVAERTLQATIPALRESLLALADAQETQQEMCDALITLADTLIEAHYGDAVAALRGGEWADGSIETAWTIARGAKRRAATRTATDACQSARSTFISHLREVITDCDEGIRTAWDASVPETTLLEKMVHDGVMAIDCAACVDAAWPYGAATEPDLGTAACAAGSLGVGTARAAATRFLGAHALEKADEQALAAVAGVMDAVGDVVRHLTSGLNMPDPTTLRLRAAEFLDLAAWKDHL